MKIERDLESTPLEIRTDSVLGSYNQVYVDFYSAGGDAAGGVKIYFFSPPQYFLRWCIGDTNFPTRLPSEIKKVWRITLNRTADIRLVIHCNEKEVVNRLISDEECETSAWKGYWNIEVAKIMFHRDDSASDGYRPQIGK